jgi:hypothetical protein
MRTGRTGVLMATLSLAVMTSLLPPARADEGSDAALKQQLEDVRRQLNELQIKLERIESAHGAGPATSAATVAAPSAAGSSAAAPSVPVGNATASTPPAAGSPVTAVPATVTPPAPAPVEAVQPLTPSAVPDAYQWREALKQQWRGVRTGMSDEEIRQLLGTPSREFTLDGKPVWYYSYPGIGNGSVLFSRDGHTVAGWQHPPFGWFW